MAKSAISCSALVIATSLMVSGQQPNTMQVTKPSDRTIVVTRIFAAPVRKVFDALTDRSHVPHWFQPKQMALVSYEADLQIGGAFRYVFQRPRGTKLEMRGIFKEVTAPHRWVHTETYDFSPLNLLVTTVLEDVNGKTVMTQTILYASPEERDSDFDSVAASSAEIYVQLDRYLESLR